MKTNFYDSQYQQQKEAINLLSMQKTNVLNLAVSLRQAAALERIADSLEKLAMLQEPAKITLDAKNEPV